MQLKSDSIPPKKPDQPEDIKSELDYVRYQMRDLSNSHE